MLSFLYRRTILQPELLTYVFFSVPLNEYDFTPQLFVISLIRITHKTNTYVYFIFVDIASSSIKVTVQTVRISDEKISLLIEKENKGLFIEREEKNTKSAEIARST